MQMCMQHLPLGNFILHPFTEKSGEYISTCDNSAANIIVNLPPSVNLPPFVCGKHVATFYSAN